MTRVVCIDNTYNPDIIMGVKYLCSLTNNGTYHKIHDLSGYFITWYSHIDYKKLFMDEIELRDRKIDEICGVM